MNFSTIDYILSIVFISMVFFGSIMFLRLQAKLSQADSLARRSDPTCLS